MESDGIPISQKLLHEMNRTAVFYSMFYPERPRTLPK